MELVEGTSPTLRGFATPWAVYSGKPRNVNLANLAKLDIHLDRNSNDGFSCGLSCKRTAVYYDPSSDSGDDVGRVAPECGDGTAMLIQDWNGSGFHGEHHNAVPEKTGATPFECEK
ncbi:hypothetical protein CABS01_04144 [Colletotrichum abscissum]|uniref:Uncharacterized protein n=1 Tax=Colletotrichum abscissum TaxID=1671311 RepID=A0A9Q0B1B6_9PEZI|nr:uncharacterized protein CABS01_04144 [Colletotrichum abscissum]KAI3542684.1 hypothetical protein CABS02_10304 [Colletotrichum abscissum]KAK1473482.1 hypothetical protein CABS01_04144 [Colletotrichum abscissum]